MNNKTTLQAAVRSMHPEVQARLELRANVDAEHFARREASAGLLDGIGEGLQVRREPLGPQ